MIKVFSKNNCVQCMFVKKWLTENEVEFVEVNVEQDENALKYIKEELGLSSLPVTLAGDDAPIVGFDIEALIQLKNK